MPNTPVTIRGAKLQRNGTIIAAIIGLLGVVWI